MKIFRIAFALVVLMTLAAGSAAYAEKPLPPGDGLGVEFWSSLTVDANPVYPSDTPTFTMQGTMDLNVANACLAIALPSNATAWSGVTTVTATANGSDISSSMGTWGTAIGSCDNTVAIAAAPTGTQWWYATMPNTGGTFQSIVITVQATVNDDTANATDGDAYTIRAAMNDSSIGSLGTWLYVDMDGNPMVQNEAATTRYVANTPGQCLGNEPCDTGTTGLQTAIDTSGVDTVIILGAYKAPAGTTVDVDPGRNITIKGQGGASLVSDAAACSTYFLTLNNSTFSVTIQDLTIDGNDNCTPGSRDGINVSAGTGAITLQSLTIQDMGTGVAGAVSFTNTGVTYNNNTTGVSITAGTANIDGDTFSSGNTTHVAISGGTLNFGTSAANSVTGGTTGIDINTTSNPTVTVGPSSGTGNTFSNVTTAIDSDSGGTIIIRRNTIGGSTTGVLVTDGTNVTINNNTIEDGTTGIDVNGGSPAITSNTIQNNSGVGLDINGTNPTVNGNTFTNNTTAAIQVNGGNAQIGTTSANTLNNNDSGGIGIDINGTSNATIQNNTIQNFATGIDVVSGAGTVNIGNMATGAASGGNTITSNTGDGIDNNDASTNIKGNTITNNGSDGVQLDAAAATIYGNTITGNISQQVNCSVATTGAAYNYLGGTISDGSNCNDVNKQLGNSITSWIDGSGTLNGVTLANAAGNAALFALSGAPFGITPSDVDSVDSSYYGVMTDDGSDTVNFNDTTTGRTVHVFNPSTSTTEWSNSSTAADVVYTVSTGDTHLVVATPTVYTTRYVANTSGECLGLSPCDTGTTGLATALGDGNATTIIIIGNYNAAPTTDHTLADGDTLKGNTASASININGACGTGTNAFLTVSGNSEIYDLIFDGTCSTDDRDIGINVTSTAGSNIHDVTVRDFGSGGIGLRYSATGGTHTLGGTGTSNTFSGNATAVSVTGAGVTVNNTNVTYDNNTTGFAISNGTATLQKDTFTNNTTGVSQSGGVLTVGSDSSTGSTFTDNTTGISSSGGTITAKDNTITGGSTGISLSVSGSDVYGNSVTGASTTQISCTSTGAAFNYLGGISTSSGFTGCTDGANQLGAGISGWDDDANFGSVSVTGAGGSVSVFSLTDDPYTFGSGGSGDLSSFYAVRSTNNDGTVTHSGGTQAKMFMAATGCSPMTYTCWESLADGRSQTGEGYYAVGTTDPTIITLTDLTARSRDTLLPALLLAVALAAIGGTLVMARRRRGAL